MDESEDAQEGLHLAQLRNDYRQVTETNQRRYSYTLEERGQNPNGWRLIRDFALDSLVDELRDEKEHTKGTINEIRNTVNGIESSSKFQNIKTDKNSVFLWLLLVLIIGIFLYQFSQSKELEVAQKDRLHNTLYIKQIELYMKQIELDLSQLKTQNWRYIQALQKSVTSVSNAVARSKDSTSKNILKASNDWQERVRALEIRMDSCETPQTTIDPIELVLVANHVNELKRLLDHVFQAQEERNQDLEDKIQELEKKLQLLHERDMISQNPDSILPIELVNYAQNVFLVNCTEYYPSFFHSVTRSLLGPSYLNILRSSKLLGESFAFDTKSGTCTLEFELSQPLKAGIFEVSHHIGSPHSKHMIQDYTWEVLQGSQWTKVSQATYRFDAEKKAKQHIQFEVEEAATQFRIVLQKTPSKDYVTVYTIQILADPLTEHR